jgi:TRAP-type mannitol/chloroaromatic compound transport system permease small subunit
VQDGATVAFRNRAIEFVDRIALNACYLASVTTALLMIFTMVAIAARLAGVPLSGVTNLSESLLVMAIYFSIAYTQQRKQHVAVEMLVGSLSEHNRKILNLINLLIPLLVCSIIVYTSWDYALESWNLRERMDGAPFYPIYPPKIAIALGISLLWLQLFVDCLRTILAASKEAGRPL